MAQGMSRNAKKTDAAPEVTPETLTPAQEAVIDHLLAGKSQAEAAALAGVAAETVSRWKRDNLLFVATWQNRRRQVWDAHAQRLRNLAGRALDVVETGLDAGDLRAAALVLKSVNLGDLAAPEAETTPEAIKQARFQEALFNFSFGG